MNNMKKKYIKIINYIVMLSFVDQLIKFFVIRNIKGSEIVIIKNFFKLTYLENDGAAFGIMGGSTIILVIVSAILIWYIINELKKNINNKLSIISFILVLSGSIGNLIDRLFYGYVIDYLSFKLFNMYMPVFNFADALITIGVFLLIITIIKEEKDGVSSRKKWRQ